MLPLASQIAIVMHFVYHVLMVGTRRYLSARVSPRTLQRLERSAQRQRRPKSALVEQYLEEALRMDEHPGIVFVDGPAGRRAALAAKRGVDIWQIVSTLKANDGSISDTARSSVLSEAEVRIALEYYRDYSDEIDAWIQANDEEYERIEATSRRQEELSPG